MNEIVLAPQPRQIEKNPEEMLRKLIDARVQEILAEKDTLSLQPFFTPKPVADMLKRLQSVHEQRKHMYYFEDYGCRFCGTRDARHAALAMCRGCFDRELARMNASIRKRMKPTEVEPARLPADRVTLATAALARPYAEPQMVLDRTDQARAALTSPRPTFAEIDQLIVTAESPRDRAIIAVLSATGCWVAELVRIGIEDIEWSNSRVEIFRQGKFWSVPLSPVAVDALRSFIGERKSGFVFEAPVRKSRPHGSGSIYAMRSGNRLVWHFRWRERAQSTEGVTYTRPRVKILGYVQSATLQPRLYTAKHGNQRHWCVSWREPSESGHGPGFTKWLGNVNKITEEQAQAQADEYVRTLAGRKRTPKLETLTREQAEAKAAEFLRETLGRTVEMDVPPPSGRPLSDRIAAEIVRSIAERAGLPHIDAESFRRKFSGGAQ